VTVFGKLPRNAQLWLSGYLKDRWARRGRPKLKEAWLILADHFEPCWRGADEKTSRRRVEVWERQWPEIAARHRDSAGRSPRYTFFYPQEEYRPDLLDPLASMTKAGIADVEVHIHHDGEGERDFLDRMTGFLDTLERQHGLLRRREGRIAFGFIHGNWALDNARPDGRWCGLNNELTLLRDLGCYADFTLPCVPDPSQAGLVNTIYWATDDPLKPRSHATGVPLASGEASTGDLLMVPGPLGLSWEGRAPWKPRIETGELAATNVRPDRNRARRWLSLSPRVGEHAFIKLFTHGAQERNSDSLLGGDLDMALGSLTAECAAGNIKVNFVSAWEAWLVLEALRLDRIPRIERGVGGGERNSEQ
jgi:hypothetical protein